MDHYKRKVNIGLPVYNGERFLKETLDSLLCQTYHDFEIIVSDNGSTDRTEEICRDYAAKDERVRYYRNATNIGVGQNFNRVFELSNSLYFKWASADDFCKPQLLARCLDVLENDDTVVLAYSKARFINEDGDDLDIADPGWDLSSAAVYERLRYCIYARHWVNCHYGLIRADALSKTRLLPSYPGGDFRLMAELSLSGKFTDIPEYLFFRRIHARASSQNTTDFKWTMKFHTGSAQRVCLPLWNLNLDHLTTIVESELNLYQKLSLVALIVKSMRREIRRLLHEVRTFLAFYGYRLHPRTRANRPLQ